LYIYKRFFKKISRKLGKTLTLATKKPANFILIWKSELLIDEKRRSICKKDKQRIICYYPLISAHVFEYDDKMRERKSWSEHFQNPIEKY
jgi:hypothetical protein